jgi:hypothetical protein
LWRTAQVIMLMLLMMLVPWAIGKSAEDWMRLKSRTAVDRYVFRWHFGEGHHEL